MPSRSTIAAVLPFGTWIALMTFLPATAGTYALRSAIVALALVFSAIVLKPSWRIAVSPLVAGLLAGALVAAIWILPEHCQWYRTWVLWPIGKDVPPELPSPYDPAVCGNWLTAAKLVGSAFVIAPAEELFFRSFLYRWLQSREWLSVPMCRFDLNAFLWMTFLFSLEHPPRFVVAAICAIVYGALAIRKGIASAIVAHIVTNLILAGYVIAAGDWGFW